MSARRSSQTGPQPIASLRQESHERADLVRLDRLQVFLDRLLAMKSDNLVTDVLRGKHFIESELRPGQP